MPSLSDTPDRHVIIDKRPGHYLCFPDICRDVSGRLIVVYREADQHVARRSKLLARISDDNGATWSDAVILHPTGGHCPRISVLNDNQICIIEDNPHCLYWSMDGFKTWNRHPYEGIIQHGIPDRLIELDTEIFLTTAHWHRGLCARPSLGQPVIEQMAYRSENRGRTFRPLAPISTTPQLALCECSMTLLPDGRLLALMRENSRVFEPMYACISEDKGETWGEPIATPLIGERPCLGQTRSGRLLVTYRNVAPDKGTVAWMGTAEALLETDYQVHGLVTPGCVHEYDDQGLHVRCDEEGSFLYCLRPLSDPAHARAELEAEVRCEEGDKNHCALRLGVWWRIRPNGIKPHIPGARWLALPEGQTNTIRISYDSGRLVLRVNGRKRKEYSLEADSIYRRAILFGSASDFEAAGRSCWKRISLRTEEPRLLRSYSWSWSASEGRPDAWAGQQILELQNDRQASSGDFGYSGWAELEDGQFCCVYHHGDGGNPDYTEGFSSHIVTTSFYDADFS